MGRCPKNAVGDDFRWLNDNLRLVHADLRGTKEGFKLVRKLPHVRTPDGAIAPRVVALAAGFLATSGYDFSENALDRLCAGFSAEHGTEAGRTVGAGSGAEAGVAGRDRGPRIESGGGPRGLVRGRAFACAAFAISARLPGKNVLEPMVLFDRVLRQDPAGAYARMDFESRDLYRTEVAKIAEYSDLTEGEVAAAALALARAAHQETHASPRLQPAWDMLGITSSRKGLPALARASGLPASAGPADRVFLAPASQRVLSSRHRSAHARHHVGDRAAADQHLHFSRTDFLLDG